MPFALMRRIAREQPHEEFNTFADVKFIQAQ